MHLAADEKIVANGCGGKNSSFAKAVKRTEEKMKMKFMVEGLTQRRAQLYMIGTGV
jgi:hypothetical protein